MHEFEQDGLFHFPQACSADEIDSVEGALVGLAQNVAGIRLHGIPALVTLLSSDGCVGRTAAKLIGKDARPVRAILFDKTETTNWRLGWHQDRTIVVRRKLEVGGFGPWTVKTGLHHVAPPIEILEGMLTLRLHIDAVTNENAPLMVAKGSHRLGRIAEPLILEIVPQSEIFACLAERGDIWAYSTPILHASELATQPSHRRVLQVDYSGAELPGGLEWLGV